MSSIRFRLVRGFVLLAGMACVAFGLALAIAARNSVEGEFNALIESIGSNLLRVRGAEGLVIEGSVTTVSIQFSQTDVDRLRASNGIVDVAATTSGLNLAGEARLTGATANYFDVHRLQLHSGRMFEEDETGVCLLGYEYAEALYGEEDPIGQTVEVRASPFLRDPPNQYRVIGVLNPMPLELGSKWLWSGALWVDIFLPATVFCAAFDQLIGIGDCAAAPYGLLWVRVDPSQPQEGLRSIMNVLGDSAQLDSIGTLYGFTFLLRRRIVALYSLAALALLMVGGVTALTMSLTTVAREARSIGTRRALGATRTAPGTQVLGLLFGHALGGIALGSACAVWFAPTFSRLLSVTLRFGPLHLAGAALLLCCVGLAGLPPALRASRVPPLRAIRSTPLRFERSPLRGVGWLVTAASIIGIASVVFVAALSDSLESALQDLYGNMEPNVVAIRGGILPGSNLPPFELSEQDIDAIFALPSVLAVSGELSVVMSEALYAGEPLMGRLVRVKSFGDSLFAGRLVSGRLPTDREMETGMAVALIGSYVAERDIEDENPIGQELVIGGRAFQIIGVFDSPKISFENSTPGWKVMVPATALDDSNNERYLAWVEMNPTYDVEETLTEIRDLIAVRHPDAAPLRVEGPATEMGRMIAVANGITYGLLRLGLLTLVVSAFALGSLFWSQTERRQQQISLERALGASLRNTFWRIFRTALLTTCISGVAAMGLGVVGAWLVQDWFSYWTRFRLDATWALWAFGAVLIAAIVGGGLPALWAARLSPMEGIRKGRL